VLFACSAYVGFDGFYFVDEGALLAEAELVSEGSWTAPRPLPELDPDGDLVAFANAVVDGDRYAPFIDHPLHTSMTAAAWRLGGLVGVRVLSVLGTVVAAAAAAALAASIDRRLSVGALWITGLVSPLLFDNQLVVAHSVGAAAMGWTAVLIARAVRGGAPWALPAVTALGAVCVFLRAEAVLVLGGMALALATVAVRDRDRTKFLLAMSLLCAALVGQFGEPVLSDLAVRGITDETKRIPSSSRGDIAEQVRAAHRAFLSPGYDPAFTRSDVLLVVAALSLAIAAVFAWRRDRVRTVVFVLAAAVAAGLRFPDPTVVPGLLLAFPLVGVLVVVSVLDRPPGPALLRQLLAGLCVAAGAILVTQYRQTGGAEWGWRYTAIVMPIIGVAVAAALARIEELLQPARGIPALFAGAALLVPVSGLVQQRENVASVAALQASARRLPSDTEADLVLATQRFYGRFAWEAVLDHPTVYVSIEELPDLLGQLDPSIDRVAVVFGAGVTVDTEDAGGFRVDGGTRRVGRGQFQAVVVAR
jgi:hypothetical protein